MSEFRHFAKLHDPVQAREALDLVYEKAVPYLYQGKKVDVKVTLESRSLDQNAVQWPYLEAFSKQLQWPVNGSMVYMEPDDWKDVLTAAFQNETVRLAMGMSGGVVMLGLRTSKMNKARFSEWTDFLKATAAMRNVKVYNDEKL